MNTTKRATTIFVILYHDNNCNLLLSFSERKSNGVGVQISVEIRCGYREHRPSSTRQSKTRLGDYLFT